MILAAIIRSGYDAARRGASLGSCPWRADTLGAHAWAFGHAIGSLPAPLRWSIVAGAWCATVARVAAHEAADFARGVMGW